jgi:two-component system, OmpR family, alkaline phosphatase synthesis response regulator PhoP
MPKILVIEDEKPVRTNIVDLLSVEGFDAIGAENGHAGLQVLREQTVDLVICDVLMPKMDGFEVLKALSHNPSTEMIPLIFLTAKTERSDIRQGMNLGAYDYITKPFTRAELLEAVNAQLKKQERLVHQTELASEQVEQVQQKLQDLKTFTEAKDQLLNNLIEELSNPMSNISMAIRLLKDEVPGPKRDRYLKILQDEFSREIDLINQVAQLQQLLTPANIKLLRQFNLLQGNTES